MIVIVTLLDLRVCIEDNYTHISNKRINAMYIWESTSDQMYSISDI